jgi:hypothetical protein
MERFALFCFHYLCLFLIFFFFQSFLTLPTCFFVSSKPNVPPLFSAVARDFAKEFDFAFVSTSDKESAKILEHLQIKVRKKRKPKK